MFIEMACATGVLLVIISTVKLKYAIYEKKSTIPFLFLFALTGIPDMLLTAKFAYLRPDMEANPLTKIFLSFEYGIILGSFLWTLFWISISEMFTTINRPVFSKATLGGLFIGHLWGFSTWAGNAALIGALPAEDKARMAAIYFFSMAIVLLLAKEANSNATGD